jgi:hypothetical protein
MMHLFYRYSLHLKPSVRGLISNQVYFPILALLLACFRSFSSYTIIGEILNTSSAKKPGQISQLHCMRFFSMCWVIFGHTMGVFLGITWNAYDVVESIGSLGGQLVANAYYAVDTFFFQAGLLLSFLWFRAFKRNPKLITSKSSWVMFYVHRFLRYPSFLILRAVFIDYHLLISS